ncbi:MAG: PocR ligand-binding domain-containing protein [Oscillospiraceae bacterium]|nr:PocR ligand-binding domain-containing protein [Oscillospiraceae bacterium]
MIEINDFKLTELIELSYLREIQERFAAATGMTAFITDADGKSVTAESNLSNFCMGMKKSVSLTTKCKNCHKNGGYQAMSSDCGNVYCCHAGVYEIAAPIVVNGKYLGAFIAGQVMTAPPDNSSAKYAIELGMQAGEYMNELSKLNVVPEGQLKAYADLLYSMAELISSKAYNEYIKRFSSDSENNFEDAASLVAKLSEVENLVQMNSDTLERLRSEFSQLENVAEKTVSEVYATKDTVKLIQDIAMNTRILGFNAYIEAARAKEYGKSFGVITEEIRAFADKSKESADKIEEAMGSISGCTNQIDKRVKNTENLLSDCVKNIEKFSMILNSMISQSESN